MLVTIITEYSFVSSFLILGFIKKATAITIKNAKQDMNMYNI